MRIQFYIIPDKTRYWVEKFEAIPSVGDTIAITDREEVIYCTR